MNNGQYGFPKNRTKIPAGINSITNNVANNLVTATGGDTLNGEDGLTFDDGGILNIVGKLTQGADCVASAKRAHAQGLNTQALGESSHAEGEETRAIGEGSHAEGIGTIASGSYQHVSGRFNTQGDTTSLFIVGNGLNDGARSDAFKVAPSGSIVLPTTVSSTPGWTGVQGEMVFGDSGAAYRMFVWLNGAWRSTPLA